MRVLNHTNLGFLVVSSVVNVVFVEPQRSMRSCGITRGHVPARKQQVIKHKLLNEIDQSQIYGSQFGWFHLLLYILNLPKLQAGLLDGVSHVLVKHSPVV